MDPLKTKKPSPLELQDDQHDSPAVTNAKALMRGNDLMAQDYKTLLAVFRDRDIWAEITNESIEAFEEVEKELDKLLGTSTSGYVAMAMIRDHLFDMRAAMGDFALFRGLGDSRIVNLENTICYHTEAYDWGELNKGSEELALNILNVCAPVFEDKELEDDFEEYIEVFPGIEVRSQVWHSYKQFAIDVVAEVPRLGGVIRVDEVHRFLVEHGVRRDQLVHPPKVSRHWATITQYPKQEEKITKA